MRLIDADALLDDIRLHSASYFADDFAREWVDKQPTIDTEHKWIPMSERPPEIGQYVLISTDMNYVATATFQGDYWQSNFDLDWEEVVAWQPTPKPYEEEK